MGTNNKKRISGENPNWSHLGNCERCSRPPDRSKSRMLWFFDNRNLHDQVDTHGAQERQCDINPETYRNSLVEPVASTARPVLRDVEEYCTKRHNSSWHE